MISYIKGDVRAISEEGFILEANNIGYFINSSLTTLANIIYFNIGKSCK